MMMMVVVVDILQRSPVLRPMWGCKVQARPGTEHGHRIDESRVAKQHDYFLTWSTLLSGDKNMTFARIAPMTAKRGHWLLREEVLYFPTTDIADTSCGVVWTNDADVGFPHRARRRRQKRPLP